MKRTKLENEIDNLSKAIKQKQRCEKNGKREWLYCEVGECDGDALYLVNEQFVCVDCLLAVIDGIEVNPIVVYKVYDESPVVRPFNTV